MIRNIIFDVGNVLVKFDYHRFMQERGYGKEEQGILLEAIFYNPLWLDADKGVVSEGELVNGFVRNAPRHETLIRDAYAHMEETVQKLSYAEKWVSDLKKWGYHLYVLSNYGKELYQRTEEKMTFLPFMDGAVFSYQCHLLKPDPAIYQYLCDTYKLLPAESVFLDDTAENVEAARKFGIHGIQVESYEQASGKLEELLRLYDEDGRMVYCCD